MPLYIFKCTFAPKTHGWAGTGEMRGIFNNVLYKFKAIVVEPMFLEQ